MNLIKAQKNQLLLLAALLLSILIRLRGFTSHFTLSSDPGRDLLVAQGAVQMGQLPWVGSFSSAGPFVFGPNWYWWLMFWRLIAGNFFLAPWIGMLFLSLSYVVVMYLVGRVAVGKRFGFVLALLTAVASQVVGLSAYLTQHAMVEIFSGLALLGVVSYIRHPRLRFAFLTAVAVGGALSMHYQAINLLLYLPILFLLEKPRREKWLVLGGILIAGLLVFLWPLLLWDASRGFQNISQLVYYFRVGQYRFFISNRWLTYLGVFWPEYLGKFLGDKILVILISIGGIFLIGKQVVTRQIPKTILFPAIIFAGQLVLLRYFRGEKYDGYLVYLHSLIIFLSGWIFLSLMRLKRLLGAAIFLLVVIFSMRLNMPILDWNNGNKELSQMVSGLVDRYPGRSFTVYARGLASSNCAYSFSAIVEGAGRGKSNGIPVGICQNGLADCGQAGAEKVGQTTFQNDSCTLVDLGRIPQKILVKKNDWYNFGATAVYDDVQNWWRKGL